MVRKQQQAPESERIEQLFSNIATKFGGMSMPDLVKNCSGLPIPYYSERYVRDSNVYITGKVEMYTGGQGSGKSSYGFHVASQFLDAGGFFFLIETENKLSPFSLEANIGRERFRSGRVQLVQAGSVDMKTDGSEEDAHLQSWQEALSGIVKGLRASKLHHYPVYILVDSMLGAAGEESRKEYDKEGQSSGRSTAEMARANSITKFLTNFTVDLRDTNILVGFTNHGKTKIQMGGMPSRGDDRSIPGGASILFHCALVLWFERGAKLKSAARAGRSTRIGCFKNSFGGEERKLGIEFWYDHIRDAEGNPVLDENQEYTRVVRWDWHGATGELLKGFCSKDNFDENLSSAEARALLDLHDKGGRISCTELGMESATAEEIGQALELRLDVERRVRSFPKLGIGQYPIIDYPNKPKS